MYSYRVKPLGRKIAGCNLSSAPPGAPTLIEGLRPSNSPTHSLCSFAVVRLSVYLSAVARSAKVDGWQATGRFRSERAVARQSPRGRPRGRVFAWQIEQVSDARGVVMPKKPRRIKRPDTLSRWVEITSLDTTLRVGVDEARGATDEQRAESNHCNLRRSVSGLGWPAARGQRVGPSPKDLASD